jgi:hypothetical protein
MQNPSYAATAEEYAKYGNTLNVWEQIRLLSQWAPLLGYGQAFANASDPYKKSLVVADAAEWIASKTNAQVDDQLVRLLADILKTPQGEALVRWCLLKAEEAK